MMMATACWRAAAHADACSKRGGGGAQRGQGRLTSMEERMMGQDCTPWMSLGLMRLTAM